MFQTKVVDKIKTHFTFSKIFSKIVPFMGCGKNRVKPDMPQMTIWRMLGTYGYKQTQNTQYSLLFHSDNGCTNEPQYCVTRTLPVFNFLCFLNLSYTSFLSPTDFPYLCQPSQSFILLDSSSFSLHVLTTSFAPRFLSIPSSSNQCSSLLSFLRIPHMNIR